MRAEFYREGDPSQVVGTATWDGRHAVIEASEGSVRAALDRIFRPVPVVVDDAAFRSLGAHGEVVIEPGSVDWFRAAAYSRAEEEGLSVRLVPEVAGQGGWDPAAAYRTFGDTMTRLVQRGTTEPDQFAST